MVFSSLTFMFYFLPIVLGIYFIMPIKWKNLSLFLANLIFYGFGEPIYIFIMIASIFIDFTHGLWIEKHKANSRKSKFFLIQSIVLNLSLLFFFKYFDFFLITLQGWTPFFDSIKPLDLPLPIGISFYTFQTMSYTIDVYRGNNKAQRNLINFGMYVTLFPQLIAGPIVKYKDVANQLIKRQITMTSFSLGIIRFSKGLFKKVLLANNIGLLWEIYRATPLHDLSVSAAWLGIIAFAFQLYFDFSGYSDMAIGLGHMFGFHFHENFNYPYIATSGTDFWRRWHISLSSWFRDYLYIPLGGNRVKTWKWCRNIILVWLATGLWHGASWNFVLWGLYYATVLIFEKQFLLKKLQQIPLIISRFYAWIVILFGWMIFAIEDSLQTTLSYIQISFGLTNAPLISDDVLYYLNNYGVILALCIFCSTPFTQKINPESKFYVIAMPCFILFTLVLSTAYLVNDSYNPFLYFRF